MKGQTEKICTQLMKKTENILYQNQQLCIRKSFFDNLCVECLHLQLKLDMAHPPILTELFKTHLHPSNQNQMTFVFNRTIETEQQSTSKAPHEPHCH